MRKLIEVNRIYTLPTALLSLRWKIWLAKSKLNVKLDFPFIHHQEKQYLPETFKLYHYFTLIHRKKTKPEQFLFNH